MVGNLKSIDAHLLLALMNEYIVIYLVTIRIQIIEYMCILEETDAKGRNSSYVSDSLVSIKLISIFMTGPFLQI